MTRRTIWQRLASAYQRIRSQYNELKADLWTFRKCWRGLAVVVALSFGVGVWIG